MPLVQLVPVANAGIRLNHGAVTSDQVAEAATYVNSRLRKARWNQAASLDIFSIIDLRMLSGLMGEMFSSALAGQRSELIKNPNMDGYPDLCDFSGRAVDLEVDFLHFPHGGIEVKNTFGYVKPGVQLQDQEERRGKIKTPLVWKAHHQETNRLLALQSDFHDGTPQIVAGYYSAELSPIDWTSKAQPKIGSTMTSFCATKSSAYKKLLAGRLFGEAAGA